jgi:zinc D-Ala-D-Ala carboxypeptidase
MTAISKYLTLEEATKSPNAIRLGISNQPNEKELKAMKYTAKNLFDPVRIFVDGPLHASSFFRSQELNDATPGSSKTSQHMKGEAVDIDCDTYGNGKNIDVFHFIKDKLVFDQLILEYPDASGKPSWIHASIVEGGKNRREVLVKLKAKYIPYSQYKVGMV